MAAEARPLLLIGPGAVGTVLGSRIAARGERVLVACRTPAGARALARQGLIAKDPRGRTVRAAVEAIANPYDANPSLVLLATKCHDAAAALESWAGRLPDDCPVVALQNGVVGDALAPRAPGGLVEAVVTFPATLEEPGKSVQTGPGGLVLGAWTPRLTHEALQGVARRLAATGPVSVTENIRGAKWTKLLINSAITTLGALTNRTLGELLTDRRARDAFLAIITEGYRAGRAEGIQFETVARFRPRLLSLPENPSSLAVRWRHGLLRLLARKYRRHRSSSLQSLERGSQTEVDFLNGMIVETARRRGLAAPVNAALVDRIHEIEGGRARPSPDLLDDLAAALGKRGSRKPLPVSVHPQGKL